MAGQHDDSSKKEQEELLAEYDLDAHGMTVHVRLTRGEDFMPQYALTYPGIGEATKLLLMSFRRELMSMVPVDPMRIDNKEYVQELNNKYIAASNLLIDKNLPGTSGETKKVLISYILNMMLGLGDLEGPLADENLEEITVNGSKSFIFVFHKIYGWCKTNIRPLNEDIIYEQAEQIGRRVGREINNLAPLMDAELADGSRVNATLFPVSQGGNTITIRKFAKNPWTMPAMIQNHTISSELAALVWLSIQNEISLLFSGGTASGKTSFLNASSIFFPANRRVISIEETRELTLPSFLQWVPMLSRQPNPEGKGEVSLYDLMINALRQRPDIVVVGEIRTGKDAETLFEAIHTGHAVYGTVHADNAQDTIERMTNPPINVPKIMLNAIGSIVVLFRHRSKGIRRVLEVGEVLRDGDVNVLYKWNMRDDTFSHVNDMSRLVETLGLYGGLTRSEILQEIAEKSKVLEWMVKNNVLDVNESGLVVAHYYKHKEKVLDLVNNDVKYDKNMFK
ncbi:MAG: Flp pilus assembly complex ATPase component TadA [Candidatus Marsarchaeota archaeon]|jgi:flagellar protein FlaI|nr:Flp pilus assembly complex ATPase component TadA [Candidatus Marsarchaeota archaeon]MCL5419081.1 Flp pilus assembly complex ATPase component TadA [Candidatus Marsarchaeota archaeon]